MISVSMWATLSAATILAVSGAAAQGQQQRSDQNRQQHTQFDEHDQQVTHEWYNQHQANPPAGFRSQDRLSPEEEGHLQEGAVLDKNMRRKVHPAPADLAQRLPPPPRDHRYVAIGGHVALIDKHNSVKAVIRLHD